MTHYGELVSGFEAGDVLASCVEPADVWCHGDIWDWHADLVPADPDLNYPAVKASRFLGPAQVAEELQAILADRSNDWRLRLEAAASLAPVDDTGVAYMFDRAMDADAKEGEQMEAVFTLTELDTAAATHALEAVAGASGKVQNEVRAAAAWVSGAGAQPSPELLVPFLADQDSIVALHAAAAMPSTLPNSVVDLLVELAAGTLREATAASHLLARHGHARRLLEATGSAPDEARAVALLAIGDAGPQQVGNAMDSVDAATAATLRTLWARRNDWLRAPDTDGGLDVLARQRVRL